MMQDTHFEESIFINSQELNIQLLILSHWNNPLYLLLKFYNCTCHDTLRDLWLMDNSYLSFKSCVDTLYSLIETKVCPRSHAFPKLNCLGPATKLTTRFFFILIFAHYFYCFIYLVAMWHPWTARRHVRWQRGTAACSLRQGTRSKAGLLASHFRTPACTK